MEDLLKVGVITTTHGVRGEVKVYPTTDDAERFLDLDYVMLDTGKEYRRLDIKNVRFFKNLAILKFDGIDNINDIGTEFGTLCDVMETGANDVYIINSKEHGEVLLPAIKECILNVDLESNTMTIHLMKGLI